MKRQWMKWAAMAMTASLMIGLSSGTLWASFCGNDGTNGMGAGDGGDGNPGCESCNSQTDMASVPSDQAICTEATSVNSIRFYTRNVFRDVTDLQVWGAVGDRPLVWKRYANSRFTGYKEWFGNGHGGWRHSYQWEMFSSGNNKLSIDEPNGLVQRFDRVNSGSPWYSFTKSADKLTQNGDEYFLQRPNGTVYRFMRHTDDGVYYQLEDITDARGNVTTLTYDGSHRLTRVTEPGGRYLEIGYLSLPIERVEKTFLVSNGTANTWNERLVSSTNAYRYVYYTHPSGSLYAAMGEIEAYDTNNNPIASTAFGAQPPYGTGYETDKVNDGNIATQYKFLYPINGYVGIDLGSAQRLSKVRYYPLAYMKPGEFYLMKDLPGEFIDVIASVTTSDGRSVTYSYTEFEDPNLPVNYQMLTGALYGDGTSATYTLEQVWSGTRPLIVSAHDPRRPGPGADIGYKYNGPTGIFGAIEKELKVVGTVTNEAISVNWISGGTKIDYPNGRTIRRSNQGGGKILSETDGLGRLRSYTWTTNQFIRTASDPLGRTYTYDTSAYGNALTNTAPDGTKRIWDRDSRERAIRYTDELGRVTEHTRDVYGRITRTDHPDGAFELFTHNSLGQPLTHTMKNGAVESWSYSANGLKLTHTDAVGKVTHYDYDAADRLCCVTDPLGRTTTWTYNERGLLTGVVNPDSTSRSMTYDLFGNKLTETDELGHVSTWTYDAYNRMITQTDPLGHTTSYEYGDPSGGAGGCSCNTGNHPTRITDPNGNVTVMTYDLEWQMTSMTDPEGNTTTWTYDLAGNRKTQTDARGNTYTWNYDNRNRVISEVNALGQTTSFTYDDAGNRLTRTSATGEITTWTYDDMNRVIAESSGNLAYEHDYDLGGRRTEMRTVVNSSVTETTTFTYDDQNRLITKTDPTGYILTYQYDDDGNRSSMEVGLPSPATPVLQVAYTYDNRNRVSTITGNGKTTTFTYDADSRRTGAVWPNNTTASYEFDDGNRLTNLVHKASGGSTIASFAYQYDQAGNRTSMTTHEGLNSYAYNDNNWLISAAYPDGHTQQFGYDAVGNRTSLTETFGGPNSRETASVFDAGNRIQSATTIDSGLGTTNTVSYAFDAAGRLTGQVVDGQNRAYTYSHRSQMTGLTDTNAVASAYGFDADQNRVAENTVRYIYDGLNLVLELENDLPKAAYVNGPGIDQPIERIQFIAGVADGRHVYHADALGSVWAMTDNLEVVAKSYTYEAFGKIRSETGTGLLFPNRYTYTARESIGDSLGFYYYRARVMDPNVGRFTSEDPLGFVDGANMFIYVGNESTNYNDPYGKQGLPPSQGVQVKGLGALLKSIQNATAKKLLLTMLDSALNMCSKTKPQGSGGCCCCVVSMCIKQADTIYVDSSIGAVHNAPCDKVVQDMASSGWIAAECPDYYAKYWGFYDW